MANIFLFVRKMWLTLYKSSIVENYSYVSNFSPSIKNFEDLLEYYLRIQDIKIIGIKQEYGSGDTYKTTIKYGDNFGNLSLYGCLVDKTSNGIIDGTWSESMVYYLSTDYKLNDKQNLSLTVLGSPLRYGWGYGENIDIYSTKLANQLSEIWGYELNNSIEQGIKFNTQVADISPSNMGKQYWKMYGNKKLKNRHDIKSLNEKESFKHTPLVNIGHNIDLSDIMGLNTQLYWVDAHG